MVDSEERTRLQREHQDWAADVPADHVQARREREVSKVKLLAVAGALSDIGLRHRTLFDGRDRIPLLRVWDPTKQHLGKTLACPRLAEGWRFAGHPTGPVLAEADEVNDPDDAAPAADLIAEAVRAMEPRDRRPGR